MKTYEIHERTEEIIKILTKIWKQSVKATHLFLTDEQINKIEQYVPLALKEVNHLIVIENDEEVKIGFAGINNQKLEMLFLLPNQRGKGIGKQVISYCIKQYNMNELTVNEQNPQAVGFYQHLGFKVYKRTELDEEGNPYPLLYMKR